MHFPWLASLMLSDVGPWEIITHLGGGAGGGLTGGATVALIFYFKFGDVFKELKALQDNFHDIDSTCHEIQKDLASFGERISSIEGFLRIGGRGRR